MARYKTKKEQRNRRHMRLRQKIAGTANLPRLAVFTSTKHIYVQLIDDDAGVTIASLSTLDKVAKDESARSNIAGGKIIGKLIAKSAIDKGINQVVFDRGGFKFHGVIKAIADSAKENGLKI